MPKLVPPFFDKFFKSHKDLLDDKSFNLDYSVSQKTKTSDGATVTSTAKILKDSKAEASVKAEYPIPKLGTLEDEISTTSKFSAVFKSVEVLTPGLKFEVEATKDAPKDSDKPPHALGLTTIYTRDHLAGKFTVKSVNPNPFGSAPTIGTLEYSGSLAFLYNNINAGVDFEGKGGKVTNNVGAFYNFGDRYIGFKTDKNFKALDFNYFQNVLPEVSAAVKVGFKFVDDKDAKGPRAVKSVTFGFENKLPEDGSFKATVAVQESASATLSLKYTTKLHAHAKMSEAAVVDLLNFNGGSHKLGFKLELGDL